VTTIGVVVIGRNEGERLRRCLQSLARRCAMTVYVDSGSTDGSPEAARVVGLDVVELDRDTPFTAARARNAGFDRLVERHPDVEFVQFVDGDCELAAGWLEAAAEALRSRPQAAVAFGRLRERHPEASVYNRLCDLEWNAAPVGEVKSCGGIALMRVCAFRQVGGFAADVLAAEDDELCLRLRRAGWAVVRIAAEMGWHDAAMTRFGQWWRRAVRCGAAWAQGAALHGRGPERHFVHERRKACLTGGVLPVLMLLLAWPTSGWSLLAALYYPLTAVRVARQTRRRGVPWRWALLNGVAVTLAKFPQCIGVCRHALHRLRSYPLRLIEYKH
jgi:GT2 family glycosyltransferase